MKDWSFVVKRRKTTLEHYLRGIDSIESALDKFRKNNIVPPPIEQIKEVLGVVDDVQPKLAPKSQSIRQYGTMSKAKKVKKQSTKKSDKKKDLIDEEPGGIDEIVIIDTENTVED